MSKKEKRDITKNLSKTLDNIHAEKDTIQRQDLHDVLTSILVGLCPSGQVSQRVMKAVDTTDFHIGIVIGAQKMLELISLPDELDVRKAEGLHELIGACQLSVMREVQQSGGIAELMLGALREMSKRKAG